MVSVGGNLYSVPDATRKRVVEVHTLADEVRIFEEGALLLLNAFSRASAEANAPEEQERGRPETICGTIAAAARTNGLPVDFFARLIWRESRFQLHQVGPVTRTGERAQCIAQFMPGTAAERHLLDPFNPVEALLKSANLLGRVTG
jgi:hypothetical protein